MEKRSDEGSSWPFASASACKGEVVLGPVGRRAEKSLGNTYVISSDSAHVSTQLVNRDSPHRPHYARQTDEGADWYTHIGLCVVGIIITCDALVSRTEEACGIMRRRLNDGRHVRLALLDQLNLIQHFVAFRTESERGRDIHSRAAWCDAATPVHAFPSAGCLWISMALCMRQGTPCADIHARTWPAGCGGGEEGLTAPVRVLCRVKFYCSHVFC